MIKQFKCINCGQCCSHIRGRISDEEKSFLEEYAYGKMPLVQLQPVEKISFPIFDFEVKPLINKAKELGIDPKIKPSRMVFDLNTNSAAIVTYYIDSDVCTFLKNNRCQAYKERPLICRFFPFNKGPYLKTGEEATKDTMFGTCPALKEVYDPIPDKGEEMVNKLKETFPEEFPEIVKHDEIMENINKTIVNLVKTKKIRPAMNYPYEFLLKRFKNSKKVDFNSWDVLV